MCTAPSPQAHSGPPLCHHGSCSECVRGGGEGTKERGRTARFPQWCALNPAPLSASAGEAGVTSLCTEIRAPLRSSWNHSPLPQEATGPCWDSRSVRTSLLQSTRLTSDTPGPGATSRMFTRATGRQWGPRPSLHSEPHPPEEPPLPALPGWNCPKTPPPAPPPLPSWPWAPAPGPSLQPCSVPWGRHLKAPSPQL